MTTVGMHEAKTRLSELVQEVEGGGEVVITRHGRAVARLVRVDPRPKDGGFGAIRGRSMVADLTWEEVHAGDAIVASLFEVDGPG